MRGGAHPGRAEPARSQVPSSVEAYFTHRMPFTRFERTAPWFFSKLCRCHQKSVLNISLGPRPSPGPPLACFLSP